MAKYDENLSHPGFEGRGFLVRSWGAFGFLLRFVSHNLYHEMAEIVRDPCSRCAYSRGCRGQASGLIPLTLSLVVPIRLTVAGVAAISTDNLFRWLTKAAELSKLASFLYDHNKLHKTSQRQVESAAVDTPDLPPYC